MARLHTPSSAHVRRIPPHARRGRPQGHDLESDDLRKAIAGSTDYDDQLKELAPTKKSIDEIYDALSMQDIKMAADAFRPLYDKSGGIHGYISYEVSPTLANDTDGTIAAARRYWAALAKPNVLIKVPSTPAGLPAIEQLISEGINVNVTLMFSMKHYDSVPRRLSVVSKRGWRRTSRSTRSGQSRACSSAGSRLWSIASSRTN